MRKTLFRDRAEAGRALARAVAHLRDPHLLVLGLPRGGVEVACEVARALAAPLDVCMVHTIGTPSEPGLGVGAVDEGGIVFLRQNLATAYGLHLGDLETLARQRRGEVIARARRLRGDLPTLDVGGQTVLLVDDGVATGGTAKAALQSLRRRGAARIIFAVPVAPREALAAIEPLADQIVCLHPQDHSTATALFYDHFSPPSDEQVSALLHRAAPLAV